MILNDLSTNISGGGPIKSAGMFFIKATQGGSAVGIAPGNKITVEQPLNGLPVDSSMKAFFFNKDSIG